MPVRKLLRIPNIIVNDQSSQSIFTFVRLLFSGIGGAIFCIPSGYIFVKAFGSTDDTTHNVSANIKPIAIPSKIIRNYIINNFPLINYPKLT